MVQETKTAIASASGPTLLCLDGDGHVLSLLWILYEAWCTACLKGGRNLRVMCAEVITAGHVLGVLQQVSGADCAAGEWSGLTVQPWATLCAFQVDLLYAESTSLRV